MSSQLSVVSVNHLQMVGRPDLQLQVNSLQRRPCCKLVARRLVACLVFLSNSCRPGDDILRLANGRVAFTGGAVQAGWRETLVCRAARTSKDPFDLLGLERGSCDTASVRTAFRRLAKVYHPDVPSTGDSAMFQAVLQAAEELSTRSGRSRWQVKPSAVRHASHRQGWGAATRSPSWGTASRQRRSGDVRIKHDPSWGEQRAGPRELQPPPLPPTATTSTAKASRTHGFRRSLVSFAAWVSLNMELGAARASLKLGAAMKSLRWRAGSC